MDGHTSHLTLNLREFRSKNGKKIVTIIGKIKDRIPLVATSAEFQQFFRQKEEQTNKVDAEKLERNQKNKTKERSNLTKKKNQTTIRR